MSSRSFCQVVHLFSIVDMLPSFAIKLIGTSYLEDDFKKGSCFNLLVAQITKECWISITTSVPQRHKSLHWIVTQPLDLNKSINSVDRDILQFQSQIDGILQQLPPLKLAICYPADYGYAYDYQLFSAFATTKEVAIEKSLSLAKILKIKQFKSFLPDRGEYGYPGDRRRHTLQNISKFFQQKLTDIKVYRLSFYDSDYAYIIGQTPNGDRLGISFSRGYEYNP